MKKEPLYAPQVGDHLKSLVKISSLCGLFFSLMATGLIWAGSDSFNCPPIIWKTSLILNFIVFVLTWLVYLPFRNTDKLLGNGLLALCVFFDLFWFFGFSTFYFYFLFSPLRLWVRITAVTWMSAMLLYRARIIWLDIIEAFGKNKRLFGRMYVCEGDSFTFRREAVGLLENARKDRNPFKSIHAYAAIFITPFTLVLNRVTAPFIGDGHGVFLVLSFFCVPMLLWGVGVVVQTFVTMVYYPIKLKRETGKTVLLKDW